MIYLQGVEEVEGHLQDGETYDTNGPQWKNNHRVLVGHVLLLLGSNSPAQEPVPLHDGGG